VWKEFVEQLNPFKPVSKVWNSISRLEGKFIKRKQVNIIDCEIRKFMEKFYDDSPVLEQKTHKNTVEEENEDLINFTILDKILKKKIKNQHLASMA
jgi:hypothetical protein